MWGMHVEWANDQSAFQCQDCFSYRSSMVLRRQLTAFPLGRSLARGESGSRPPSRHHWHVAQSGELSSQQKVHSKAGNIARRAKRARDEEIRYVDVVEEGIWTLIERRWR